MNLNELLKRLVRQGCNPSIYYRGGGVWRAHINRCGNHWREGPTPWAALSKADTAWKVAGKPMDGVPAEAADAAEGGS